MERIVKTHGWSKLVNLSISGMVMLDTDNVYSDCSDHRHMYATP